MLTQVPRLLATAASATGDYLGRHPLYTLWLLAQMIVGVVYFVPESHGINGVLEKGTAMLAMAALLFPGALVVARLSDVLIPCLEAHDIYIGPGDSYHARYEMGEWLVAAVITYLFWTCLVQPLARRHLMTKPSP
jgi:hypothetical protein